MKKNNKKRIVILIILIVMLIIQIKAFTDSRAKKLTDITAKIVDTSGLLSDEIYMLQAVNEEESGIVITLPSVVNEKKIEKYIVEVKQIQETEESKNSTQNKELENSTEVIDIEKVETEENTTQVIEENKEEQVETIQKENTEEQTNTKQEEVAQEKVEVESDEKMETEKEVEEINVEPKIEEEIETNPETLQTELNELSEQPENIERIEKTEPIEQSQQTEQIITQEKLPGEKLYLTEQEIEAGEITLKAIYETKQKNEQSLYNKVLETETEEHKITIVGYMPSEAKINVEKVEEEIVTPKLEQHMNENTTLRVAYDITIKVGEQEYEPNEFDENVEVTISGITTVEEEIYKVVHIDDENNTEEIQEVEIQEDRVIFNAKEFSTYAVLSEVATAAEIVADDVTTNTSEFTPQNTWDGSTKATTFSWGQGTAEKPYLIADGAELAYLAQQVNDGTTYEGQYFQLASDIDLGNNEWTPIGTTENSFRGIIDGAGHTIANAKITISSLPDQTYESYGIFGSIGGGNSRTIIRNVELTSIEIDITADGSTAGDGWFATQNEEGIRVGCLTGTQYKNSNIENVIVSNSIISDTNEIQVYNYQFQFAVGGVVGYITNTSTSDNDPGNGSRYIINNCYSNVEITLDATASVTTNGWNRRDGRGQYHTGGIVGTIRSQPVWPTNCLYDGKIQGNGYIGPIFAGLINNTSYESMSQVIWNGNDSGNLTTNNAYYTNYTANGTTFTQSVTSGTSTARRSNTTSNVGYVQGVNKGSYTTNMTTMLNIFNGNITTDNKYLTWVYENNVFTFKERLTTNKTEPDIFTYKININDPYQVGTYIMTWYKNGTEETTIQSDTYIWTPTYEQDENMVVVTYDGNYYSITKFTISRIHVDIVFDVDENNDKVTATLEGEGMKYTSVNDYTFQWYKYDITGEGESIQGETSLILENLEDGIDYKLVATNTVIPELTTENMFTYGDRTVIYVDYSNGNNNRDGLTPETAVRSLPTAYGKLDAGGTISSNIIVIMGNYTTRDVFYNTKDSTNTTYQKSATITGKYGGIDYDGTLYMYYSSSTYNFINGNTNFQYLTFNGNGGQAYLYAQGHNLTMGKGLHMENYSSANTNQGLITGSAPAFHVLGGYLQYNRTKLPRNNGKVVIKSGAYGRVLGGGGSGTSSGAGQTTSHDFTGSNLTDDIYTASILIDIQESTKGNYTYDVNLVVGGATAGNMYADITIDVKNGSVGRLLGGSIGDRIQLRNWNYPENTFIGYTTINLNGGTIQELYGGSLGRNMDAIGNGGSTLVCDIYHYGEININISGSTVVNSNIYGAGAGGVTGYHENSTDTYRDYGKDIPTSVNLNITGGTINGNIYGGGYGYTEYLTERVTADDGGALYGDSNIIIDGTPTINGNIYAAGCGYDFSSKPEIAQMIGTSNIQIKGIPIIEGQIFGAGQGISGYDEMAKLTGNSNIQIEADLSTEVYGGGNISVAEGNTYINIEKGTHTGDIYGGGNLGIINGTTNVNINDGTQNRVFGGGNQAEVTNSIVTVNGGTTSEIYAGGNAASVTSTKTYVNGGNITKLFGGSNTQGDVTTSEIQVDGGITQNIYGGNNQGGTTETSNIQINKGTIVDVYGGGDQALSTTSNITTTGGKINNIYGGGNQAGVTTTNITTNGGNIGTVFGGSNKSGNVTTSYITTNDGENESIIETVYGGNNQGGTTSTTNVTINGGGVNNVYGGGNQAVTNETNVNINGQVIKNVFGGGNQAGVNTNTNVKLTGATVGDNVYGGGNEGTVTQNTNVNVKNSILKNSLYAGGNGTSAIVYGNVNVTMEGFNQITNSVFGGGNQAATGTEETNNSQSTVNIVGGTIGKNVYGGANTSVVYGTTQTNIGYDAVGNTDLEIGDINIGGTVFGGGEANASGSEVYDFNFISVTVGIDIQINGNKHENFAILGSIFGSGNASSTSGTSYITIKNYGTPDKPQSNISLQRANCATIINSALSLSGATDRTNEYSGTFFSISRVDEVKLKNNSTLYLCNGANLLTKLHSLVDIDGAEVKGSVSIEEETGATTKNVDNRVYMLEGKNLNIALNEKATLYGQVQGMFFFGLFTNRNNPATSTGLYHNGYNNGEEITNAGTFVSNSYVMAEHLTNPEHDIKVDGFYTNYNEEGIIKTDYIQPTPEEDVYYMWLCGEEMEVKVFPIEMVASKYATLGTYELALAGFADPNIKFTIAGFSSGLIGSASLVDPSLIQTIEPDENLANSQFGLMMKTGNIGWQTKGDTTFLTKDGGTYTGTTNYNSDNTNYTPTLNFCFYHSQNLTKKQALGDVKIRLQVMTPIDDLNYHISYIDIDITLSTALFQDDYYEAAITPGQEFGLFTTTDTTITKSSSFSTYYSLLLQDFSTRDDAQEFASYNRVLVSRDVNNSPYVFPVNTKITMLDMVTDQYYYYIVTEQDITDGKYIYELADFIAMGSNNNNFNESEMFNLYYNTEQDLIYENFIFHVNFGDSELDENIAQNSLLMELRDDENQTIIGVLGIQRENIVYTVFCDKEATIEVDATIDPETIYLGNPINLNVTTSFTQEIIGTKTIYDTQYFDKKLGIKISIYDNNGNRLNNDSLLGINFELDGKLYYPRVDGTTRISIADKVTDVLAKLKINTENNETLATGNYKIRVESFGSSDGIYYGLVASDMVEVDVTIINFAYGLKVTTQDKAKIVDNETGLTVAKSNTISTTLQYSSSLSNPNIAISLYRRDYSEIYSQNYTLVDLKDYVSTILTATPREKEYVVSTGPLPTATYYLSLKDNLVTGTYKLVYKLYDGNTYIGETYEYMIIK